jgi:hypothetical protein
MQCKTVTFVTVTVKLQVAQQLARQLCCGSSELLCCRCGTNMRSHQPCLNKQMQLQLARLQQTSYGQQHCRQLVSRGCTMPRVLRSMIQPRFVVLAQLVRRKAAANAPATACGGPRLSEVPRAHRVSEALRAFIFDGKKPAQGQDGRLRKKKLKTVYCLSDAARSSGGDTCCWPTRARDEGATGAPRQPAARIIVYFTLHASLRVRCQLRCNFQARGGRPRSFLLLHDALEARIK